MNPFPDQFTCYLAATGFEDQLAKELGSAVFQRYESLFLCEGAPKPVLWAQNVWLSPRILTIQSISDAAKQLKNLQRNWTHYPIQNRRRGILIQEQLPYVSAKPIEFPSITPVAPMGSWGMLSDTQLLVSPNCSSPFANGEYHFSEDKVGPPSRAYLKLWEALTRLQQFPSRGQRCLEIGASPGSWSWALSRLGAEVFCVDRAPLDPKIAANPLVHFTKGNAFTQLPEIHEKFDWIFSDVICYPEKLLEWVSAWLDSGKCENFVCTIKLQGEDQDLFVKKFASIPGSFVVHLFHNKHELTWFRLKP